jgi:uncharacterized membrane protein YbaN (DUF454 family)
LLRLLQDSPAVSRNSPCFLLNDVLLRHRLFGKISSEWQHNRVAVAHAGISNG